MTSVTERVRAIINEQGREVTYKTKVSTSRNSTTLKKTVTLTSTTIRASIRNYKSNELSALVQEGDRELKIAADEITFIPEANDKITVDGLDFNVVAVNIIKNRNVDAIYVLRIRGRNSTTGV